VVLVLSSDGLDNFKDANSLCARCPEAFQIVASKAEGKTDAGLAKARISD